MSDLGVQTSPQPAPIDPFAAEAPRKEAPRPRTPKGPVRIALETLASLKLTVVLLALCIVLVFCGTLAQIDHGIWAVVKSYFRSFFVWIPFQLFFPRSLKIPLFVGLPFPGGLTLGALLLVNLLAAHLTRFKISWKRSGILLIHAGLIVLMLSELVTGQFAVEGNMSIVTGSSSNFIERNDRMELAVVSPVDAKNEEVTAVPASILRKGGLIRNDNLPFDVKVLKYMANTNDLVMTNVDIMATAGIGLKYTAKEQPEGVGVDNDQKWDAPSAYVDLKKKGTDESLGVYLVSAMYRQPQTVDVDGQKYEIALRPHRDFTDFTMQLLDFKHDVYIGTNIPKDFRSRVHLMDPKRAEDREVEIYMNAPLRYQGETFYQSGVVGNDEGTILQVVRNPAWWWPYLACAMVILGLAVHFGMNLVVFLRRRAMS